MLTVGAIAVGLLVALVFLLLPKEGTLIVTVAGPGSKRIDNVHVIVDGAKKCESSPCRVDKLPTGTHTVRVSAEGYEETADKVVQIRSGQEAIEDFELARASEGTGIRVAAEGAGLRLYVDGKEIGPLPQELKDMSPGQHTVRVAGSDRFKPYEETVTVVPDQLKALGPLKLEVLKGLAIIERGKNAEGAKVLLVSGAERRPIPKLPIKLDIRTDKSYRLVAVKPGYEKYDQPIEFEPGKAERTFTIDLDEGAAVATVPVYTPRPGGGGARVPAPAPKPAATGATGTLNINSIPVSLVVLDGVPKGTTPKIGLKVPAGAHTVLFIHKDKGRKTVSVKVPAGGKATAMARF